MNSMPRASACPSDLELRNLKTGSMPGSAAETVEEHVLHCSSCFDRFKALPVEDPLVEVIRQSPPTTVHEIADESRLDSLIHRLKSLRPLSAAGTERASHEPVRPDDDRSLTMRQQEKAMAAQESTCWSVIRAAAAGSSADREALGRHYLGIVHTYLTSRWRGSALGPHLDDAVQEVLVECICQGGALEAAGAGRVPSFRDFLHGVVRNVARRFESRPVPTAEPLPDIPAAETRLARLFEETWAQAIMTEAALLQRQQAAASGPEAARRVQLLRLHFRRGRSIRTIAKRWGVPASALHHAYALARQDFRAALLKVVAFHCPGSPAEVEQEAASLLRALP
jgi:RNA polymerase sigma-70 factor (ECF subfamily)